METMTFENCDLFKRSFTTQGLGFTFNNEPERILIKKKYRSINFFHNVNRRPSSMKSTNLKHSLTAVIDSNYEEVETYKNSRKNATGIVHRPSEILVSLHS